jgi:cellulose synthase/poly-beta-1,6-N-acetylglucosamine synthase-like glycosyltransferase
MGLNPLLWAVPATVFAGFWVFWQVGNVLLAAFYQRVLYPRWRKRSYDENYLPRCSLIVPCKGIPRHFEENLRALLRQEYARYEVIFCVEAESDPAVPIIRRVLAARRDGDVESSHASLVIAGLTAKCAQKVHNQLVALQHVEEPEVLVFADSDVKPAPGWLRQLVLPLSDPRVSIAGGFYWLVPQAGTRFPSLLGELAHCQMNRAMYALFVSSMSWGGLGVWGGGMAMRKADFAALRIASHWQECVVDDMSLAEIAVRRKLRTVVVPECIILTDDAKQTVEDAADWFARQLMLVKAHGWELWAFGVLLCFAYLAVSALLPVSVIASLVGEGSFWEWGGGAALILIVGEMLIALSCVLLGRSPRFLALTLLAPLLRYAQGLSVFKTIGSWTIHWSGVSYTIDRSGRVVLIER